MRAALWAACHLLSRQMARQGVLFEGKRAYVSSGVVPMVCKFEGLPCRAKHLGCSAIPPPMGADMPVYAHVALARS